jgi:hypothetical protein
MKNILRRHESFFEKQEIRFICSFWSISMQDSGSGSTTLIFLARARDVERAFFLSQDLTLQHSIALDGFEEI